MINRKAKRADRFHTISLAIEGEGLPTEFRLFVRGWNSSEKGKFLFDAAAAAAVLAAYDKWGIDLAIDLEHQMVQVEPGAADPTARDARGWCKLEVRPDGSLWAVDVTWTPDGATRLTNKTQRYVSPCFESDPKTKRIVKMINVAITALPATHDTPALVAASASGKGKAMDPKLIAAALEAIEKGDAKSALDLLKQLVASAAGADPSADSDPPGSEGDGAEGVADPSTDESIIDPKVVAEGDVPPPDADPPVDPKKKTTTNALLGMLSRLTGKRDLAEAVAEVETFRASHLALETKTQALAAERATLEKAERRQLVTKLVALKAEFPSTVWADDKSTTIKPRWIKMPIEELRAHVADQAAARAPKKQADGLRPAVGGSDSSIVSLSVEELAICAAMKCEPKDFAALKAFRDGKGS